MTRTEELRIRTLELAIGRTSLTADIQIVLADAEQMYVWLRKGLPQETPDADV